ncbi:hypothetical protein [Undibacterium sp. RuTC16W]|uniref:hypothetical protein n=1 Tax=Undibacterium sp. RuTC16W TaxID=3413048 RepID=UPI003BF1CFBC
MSIVISGMAGKISTLTHISSIFKNLNYASSPSTIQAHPLASASAGYSRIEYANAHTRSITLRMLIPSKTLFSRW